MKTVFVVMNAEILHPGHLNILKTARELGEVTVGLATDEFAARYKRLPLMSYEQRKAILENIRGVNRVIPQETLDLEPVLRQLKPDYFVHGDDWKTGRLQSVRRQVIELLEEWGGQLVEPAYTEGISSTQLDAAVRRAGLSKEERSRRFRRLLGFQPIVRILEVHDDLSGLIADRAQVQVSGKPEVFDALYLSAPGGLLRWPETAPRNADSMADMNLVHAILGTTTKPLIVEANGDLGYDKIPACIKTLERSGAAALVLGENPADDESSAGRIRAAKNAQMTADFSVLVRMNSIFLPHDEEISISNTEMYLQAGADALIISFGPGPQEQQLNFLLRCASRGIRAPLLAAVPAGTTIDERRWSNAGAKGIIYEGCLLRTACDAMKQASELLLMRLAV